MLIKQTTSKKKLKLTARTFKNPSREDRVVEYLHEETNISREMSYDMCTHDITHSVTYNVYKAHSSGACVERLNSLLGRKMSRKKKT